MIGEDKEFNGKLYVKIEADSSQTLRITPEMLAFATLVNGYVTSHNKAIGEK